MYVTLTWFKHMSKLRTKMKILQFSRVPNNTLQIDSFAQSALFNERLLQFQKLIIPWERLQIQYVRNHLERLWGSLPQLPFQLVERSPCSSNAAFWHLKAAVRMPEVEKRLYVAIFRRLCRQTKLADEWKLSLKLTQKLRTMFRR